MKEFWKSLSPKTRQVFIAVAGAVVVASMYFGVFSELMEWVLS